MKSKAAKSKVVKAKNAPVIEIISVGNKFVLEGVKTPQGNLLACESRDLLEEIAGEGKKRRKWDATRFGFYSIISSAIDHEVFIKQIPEGDLLHMVEGDPVFSPEDHHCAFTMIADETKDLLKLLCKEFGWPDITVDGKLTSKEKVDIIKAYLWSQPYPVKVAIVLLNGMYSAHLSNLILIAAGKQSVGDMASVATHGYQIDDPEQFKVRKEFDYIENYLELMATQVPMAGAV